MAENHCSDCKFFVDHDQMGQCRRFPHYQNRHRREWCGEFCPVAVDTTFEPKEVIVVAEKRKPGRPKKNA